MAEAKKEEVKQEMRFSDEEINIFRGVFGGNEKLVRLIRKLFLPTMDFEAPLGQMIDLYMTLPVTHETLADDVKVAVMSRNQLIAHIEHCLMQITVLSQPELPTAPNPKDSSK
jgi:hypothetical protein